MGLLRDLGHPVEVWGWDEAYVAVTAADPDRSRSTDPHGHLVGNRAVLLGRHQRQQTARQGRHRLRETGRHIRAHRRELDDPDGRPSGRHTVGRWPQDSEKACSPWHHHGPRARLRRRRAADLRIRPAHRSVAAAAGQGRRRYRRQRATLDSALPQSRHHLSARPHRSGRNGFGRNTIGPPSIGGRVGVGTDRHPGCGYRAHRNVLHTHQDPQAGRAHHRCRHHHRSRPARLDLFELDRPVRLLGVRLELAMPE